MLARPLRPASCLAKMLVMAAKPPPRRLIAVFSALLSCRAAEATAPPAAARAVNVASVIVEAVRPARTFGGHLEAVERVEVRSRVSGFVEAVSFTEGAVVQRNQLLFALESRAFRLEVERATAEAERCRAELELARKYVERGRQLLAARTISEEALDRLVADESRSESCLAAARASLGKASLELSYTRVRSPIDGRVSRALIRVGGLVSSQDVLTTVVSETPIYARFDVDEETYLRFSLGGRLDGLETIPVFMGLTHEEGHPHAGRLHFLDNQIEPATGTIAARAVFDNPDRELSPGLFARVSLEVGPPEDTILVDERAVATDLDRRYVLALGPENVLQYRAVRLGAPVRGLRAVEDGLGHDDVIVVTGLQHVRAGDKVIPQRVDMSDPRRFVAPSTAEVVP